MKLEVETGDSAVVVVVLAATTGTWLFRENNLGTSNYGIASDSSKLFAV